MTDSDKEVQYLEDIEEHTIHCAEEEFTREK